MKSPKSASASQRRSKHDIKHLLKRRPHYREYRIEDEKWFWADWKILNAEGEREEFAAAVLPNIDERLNRGYSLYALLAPVNGNEKVVGMVTSIPIDGSYDMMEPHVYWFSWASTRNRIEAAAGFIEGMRRMFDIYITTTEPALYDRISKYHVLRKVGKLERRVGGQDAHLYQSRRF